MKMKTLDLLTALVLACPALVFVAPAHAQTYRCETKSLAATDHHRLERGAERALKPLEIEWGDASYCNNPSGALAWLSTKPVQQADGTRLWTRARCSRARRAWTCEPTPHRTMIAVVDALGPRNTLTTYIPLDMDVSTAQAVVAKTYAIVIGAEPMEGGCAPRDRGDLDKLRSDFLGESGDLSIELNDTVAGAGRVLEVIRELAFVWLEVMPGPDGPQFKYRCFGELIIVT